jgi:hypothetical protein
MKVGEDTIQAALESNQDHGQAFVELPINFGPNFRRAASCDSGILS